MYVAKIEAGSKQNSVQEKRLQKLKRTDAWWSQRMWEWEYRVFAREFFSRAIRWHLSPAQWCVLDFVYDRTLQWGKEWETIRMKQFVNGSLPDIDGFQAFCGIGLSQKTVERALTELKDAGIVLGREKANGNGLREYSIARVDHIRDLQWSKDKGIRYRANWPGTKTEVLVCA